MILKKEIKKIIFCILNDARDQIVLIFPKYKSIFKNKQTSIQELKALIDSKNFRVRLPIVTHGKKANYIGSGLQLIMVVGLAKNCFSYIKKNELEKCIQYIYLMSRGIDLFRQTLHVEGYLSGKFIPYKFPDDDSLPVQSLLYMIWHELAPKISNKTALAGAGKKRYENELIICEAAVEVGWDKYGRQEAARKVVALLKAKGNQRGFSYDTVYKVLKKNNYKSKSRNKSA